MYGTMVNLQNLQHSRSNPVSKKGSGMSDVPNPMRPIKP